MLMLGTHTRYMSAGQSMRLDTWNYFLHIISKYNYVVLKSRPPHTEETLGHMLKQNIGYSISPIAIRDIMCE
jgi:hypothetical protein